MKILHISDLHYGEKFANNINRMMKPFLDTIEIEKNKSKFDLVVFTGDLVYAGAIKSDFEKVKNEFIEPLLKVLELTMENFLICPGNHDMSANAKEMPAIRNHIDKFSNNEELDEFVKDESQFTPSYTNSENYFNFVKAQYPKDIVKKLYHVFERKIDDKEIAVISFHTAWRSFIGVKPSSLLLPKYIIFDALKKVKSKAMYISLMHHPVKDLKNFNCYEIEDLLAENFQINFSGHYHKKNQNIKILSDTAMLDVGATATMGGNESSIGFAIANINIDDFEIEISNYIYNENENKFMVVSNTQHSLIMNEDKKKYIELKKKIKSFTNNIENEAKTLLVADESKSEATLFNDLFNCPILKEKSFYDNSNLRIEKTRQLKTLKNFAISDLINNSFIIYGKDKYGKTTLLRKLQLDILHGFKSHSIIPIFFDLKTIKFEKKISLEKTVQSIFNLKSDDSKKMLSQYNFHLLYDNFDSENSSHKSIVMAHLGECKNAKITITAEENYKSYLSKFELGSFSISSVFIHPLTRKIIREQVSKVLIKHDSKIKTEAIERVSQIFTQMNIPFNFWYLSLFLWVYSNNLKFDSNDNIEILTLYIDKLLERENIAKSGKKIDYEILQILLSNLAHEMLINHKNKNYRMQGEEIIEFIKKFKDSNIRFVTDVLDFFNFLVEKGILKQDYSQGGYSFRLNGVMEYFLAIYMRNNENFLNDILDNNEKFLSFANEIEIVSGLNRKNEALIVKLFQKANNAINDLKEKKVDNFDDKLMEKLKNSVGIAHKLRKIRINDQTPITPETQDDFLDDSSPAQEFNEDVKIKEELIVGKSFSLGQIARHIFILARATRSMTLIDSTLVKRNFDFIISAYINVGFNLMDILIVDESITEAQIRKKLNDLFNSILPIITQAIIADAILHKTIDRVIESRIEKLELDYANNQYELMILYFLLLDLDLKHNIKVLEKIEKNLFLQPIANASLIKILYLLLFKVDKNKNLENILKESAIKIQKSINPYANESELNTNLNKLILLNHQKIKD